MDVQPTSALIMPECEDGLLGCVHSIDMLILIYVETGFAMNLR